MYFFNFMSNYTQILYHIVFSTKHRQPTLLKSSRPELYSYINGILKNKNCHVYQINGVEDHLHILTDLHPTVSLASLIKDIKVASNIFIKENNLFPNFIGWQQGYGAFTYSYKDKDALINYVKNQEEHHKTVNPYDELVNLLKDHGVEFDKKYL